MFESTPRLDLPLIQQSQAQKHVTHNEALAVLDALVQPVALDAHRTVPPTTPSEGDMHVVAPGAGDAWAGQDGALAVYFNTGWTFRVPFAGWSIHVLALGRSMIFDGTGWADTSDSSVDKQGINTAADTVNRLSVSAAGTLLTHEGADHRLTVNKATTGDTASLLFQTGWSGRAEMGTTGNDRFSIKISPDGTTWHEGMTFDAASGVPSFPKLPHFVVTASGGWEEITTPDTDLVFDVVETDPGGHYDMIAGGFIAPVAGVYCFVLNGFLAASTDGRVSLAVNGVTQASQMQVLKGAMPLSFTVLETLQAGDLVSFRTGNVNTMLNYFKGHTAFSGWKIG